MKYLVTGATGQLGGYALKYLRSYVPASGIVALARDEVKAKTLRDSGIEVRTGSYDDPASLEKAFHGIDRMLFISSLPGENIDRQHQHKNVVDAAKKSGVSFIAYTSVANARDSHCMVAPDHKYTEQLISASGIDHVFLRNNWYLENEKSIIDGALQGGRFVYGAGGGQVGWALKREYGEAAARILSGVTGAVGDILELSGKPATYAELASALREASGKDFEVLSLDSDGYRKSLEAAGVPQGFADYLVAMHAEIKDGVLDVESKDFEKVLGKPLTSLKDAVAELLV